MSYLLSITIALITAIFGPMLVEWFKSKITTKKMDPVGEAIKHNEIIDHQLDLILEEIDCKRIWVAMFHNGGHFYPTGKSIQKFSIFHEKTSIDTISIIDTLQNIPVSLFSKALSKLYNDNEVYIGNNESFDSIFFSKNSDTKALYLFTIEDLEGRFIGMLALEFGDERKFLKEEFIFIRQKVGAIGGILTNYLYNTNKK